MKRVIMILPIFIVGLGISGCENRNDAEDENFGDNTLFSEDTLTVAVAQLEPVGSGSAMGTITFRSTEMDMEEGELEVEGEVMGLSEGRHGFHVHEGTSCSQPGDHLNPDNVTHGSPDSSSRHLGDLGNIEADSDSTATFDFTFDRIQLEGINSIVGHALVVHENEDDLMTDPSGNSGQAIACGVIQLQDDEMR